MIRCNLGLCLKSVHLIITNVVPWGYVLVDSRWVVSKCPGTLEPRVTSAVTTCMTIGLSRMSFKTTSILNDVLHPHTARSQTTATATRTRTRTTITSTTVTTQQILEHYEFVSKDATVLGQWDNFSHPWGLRKGTICGGRFLRWPGWGWSRPFPCSANDVLQQMSSTSRVQFGILELPQTILGIET